VKDSSRGGLHPTKQLYIGCRILDHMVQDAEADDQVKEVIGIRKSRRIHLREFGGQPEPSSRLPGGFDCGA